MTQAGGFLLGVALLMGLWWAMAHWPLANHLAVDQWRLAGRAFPLSLVVILLVVGPPSFLIGMTFPFVQRAVQRDLATVGARVGWVQLANILGNAAGSILTGLVTLHVLGTAGTLQLLAVLSLLLLAIWLVQSWRLPAGTRWRAYAAFAGTAVVLAAVPANATLWQRLHAVSPGGAHAWGEDRSGVALWREEGLHRGDGAPGPFFIMGHSQATIPFSPHHMLLGAAGPLLHPSPDRVMAVGVGSAGSPWGVAAVPAVREFRAVELVAPVLTVLRDHAALHPEGAVATLLEDPRVRLEAGDGRRALARSAPGSLDIIQADAIYPQTSHSGLLYSREYLELVRSRLAPGGMAVQWAPTWSVVETFVSVFPHVVMLRPASILIGSDRPIPDARARLQASLAEPAMQARLRQGNPDRGAGAASEIGGEMLVWSPATPRGPAPLTDMAPRDEFFMNNTVRDTWQSTPPPGLGAQVVR
jgi:hypothetical protein